MAAILPIPIEPTAPRASFRAAGRVGDWNRRRPDLLSAALDRVRRTAPAALGLAHEILPRLPRNVRCSQNHRTSCRARFSFEIGLDIAATIPWVSLDSETRRNALVLDIDHADVIELAAALPPHVRPMLVIDPRSGRSHAIFFLRTPVAMGKDASRKAQWAADYTIRLLAAFFRATPLGHRCLVKNPLGLVSDLAGERLLRGVRPETPAVWDAWKAAGTGLVWHTIPGAGPVELRDIIAALAEEHGEEAKEMARERARRERRRKARPEPSALGRNCSLFDLVRWWAYDRDERDGGLILAEAMRVNATFAEPLPAAEVTATAKSIARFMLSRFRPGTGASSTRGRDSTIGAGLTIEARQIVAGRVSAAARAATTDAKIAAAMDRLREGAKRVTQAAVAGEAGVSLRTVKARWIGLTQPPVMVQDGVLSGSATAIRASQMEEETPAASGAAISGRPTLAPELDSIGQDTPRAGDDGLELAPFHHQQPAAGGDAGVAKIGQRHRQPFLRRDKDASLRRMGLRRQRGQVEKARTQFAYRRHGGFIGRRRVRHAPMSPQPSLRQRVIRHWRRRPRDGPDRHSTSSARLQRPALRLIFAAVLLPTRVVRPGGR
ncbi:primase C-terminal domain-containing protein [Neoroseomonas lacus]|uniref:Primase C-terminal 1 domain-containing protein n=1 Tax=Neoroseomonas lacus TaxID=287609 RepID=A0A917NJF6_9PROT|nr:replication initiation protein [Neoroseomonas lacus]GGJ05045.1 hypothetical protein GCM10011320_09960 [Neoroseomonas lacus]